MLRPAIESSPLRSDRIWAVGLFTLALTLRLAHLATLRGTPFFEHLLLDPRMYDEWGMRIAAGAWLGDGPFFQDPLYAYVLAAFYAVFGHRHEPVLVAQAILGAAVAPMLLLAARRWFGSAAARATGVIAALYLPSIYYGGLILKTGLALFLISLLLLQLSGAAARGGRTAWIAIGGVLGLACLTRGNLVLFVPVLALWILIRERSDDADVGARASRGRVVDRSRWVELAFYFAGVALVLGFSAAHNRAVSGEWILTTANAGQNLYLGNNPLNDSGEYQPLPFVDSNPMYEQRDFAREAERRTGRSMSPREVSRFWFREATSWIRGHPDDWMRLTRLKLGVYRGAFEVPDNLDYYFYREHAPLLRLPIPGFGLVAPLGLLGALLSLRRRGWPRLLLAYVVVYSASVVAFFVFSRFRMVVMPALFVFAGYATVELARRFHAVRDRSWRPALTATGLLLVLIGTVNLPIRAVRASWSYRLASSVGLPTRPETTALAHYNLGLVYAGHAKEAEHPRVWLERAGEELGRALELDAGQPKFHVELGKVLAQQQLNREAIEQYRAAERLDPNDYRTAHSLGLLHRRVDDLPGAEESFRRALALAPRHVASAVQLGEVLLARGRPGEAAGAFRHALGLAPDSARARRGLESAEAESSREPG